MIYLSERRFLSLVRRAYREVPPSMKRALRNLDILVEEWPSPSDLELVGEGQTLFGLYTGVPLIDREGPEPPLPDCITIFRQPIMQSCDSEEEAEKEIRITLLHEIGHYLGMTEEDLHRLGYG